MSGPVMSIDVGGARKREEAARDRRARYQSSPEVRAQLAAVLEARDALHEAQQATVKAEREATPDALRAVLSRGTIDELAEISRSVSRYDGRRLQSIVDEVFRDRSRSGYVPAAQEAQEAVPAERASSARRRS